MSTGDVAILAALIFAAAALYTSVGHAGASGYIAAMAFFGLAPDVMKPTALTLNILVASLATMRLQQAGLIKWRTLLPLVVASIPMAFIGGAIQLPGHWYRALIGLVLLAAAARLFLDPRPASSEPARVRPMPTWAATVTGGAVGLLSGLTGTGGGIFLSPVLIVFRLANPRQQPGLTGPFILVNSVAGLAGNLVSLRRLPAEIPYWMVAALLGAVLGTQLGIRWLGVRGLQKALAVVLVIAAAKFILA